MSSPSKQQERQSERQHIVLVGNPGVGKTFLLNHLVHPHKFRTGGGLLPVTLNHEWAEKGGVYYRNIPGIITSTVEETEANIAKMEQALLQEGQYKVAFVMAPNGGGRNLMNAIDVNEYFEFCEAYGMGKGVVPIIFNNLPDSSGSGSGGSGRGCPTRAESLAYLASECQSVGIHHYTAIFHASSVTSAAEEYSPEVAQKLVEVLRSLPWKPIQKRRDMDLFNSEKLALLTRQLEVAASRMAEVEAQAKAAEAEANAAKAASEVASKRAKVAEKEASEAQQEVSSLQRELSRVQQEEQQKMSSLQRQLSRDQTQLTSLTQRLHSANSDSSNASKLSSLRSQIAEVERQVSEANARTARIQEAASNRYPQLQPHPMMMLGGGGFMMMPPGMGGGVILGGGFPFGFR